MSWRHAPLYVEAHDLAAWLLARVSSWGVARRALALRIAGAACDLADASALALTFPDTRARHLERADEAIVVLRTELRLAETLEWLSARRLRFACDRLREIGRMVGGWRKQVDGPRRGAGWRDQVSGDGPPTARTA